MNFATLKGLTIPEGNVTKITDGSGRVMWSAAPKIKFAPIVDFGAVTTSETPNATTGYYPQGGAILLNPLPSGWDACTHIAVNGEVYEVTLNVVPAGGTGNTYVYTPVGDCLVVGISMLAAIPSAPSRVVNMNFKELGTYTVQLGLGILYGQITFTLNGDTYIADKGMTWNDWFASDYNTTGETEGDIKDVNGNEVSMDAVIVDGAVYNVEFVEMATITITGNSKYQGRYGSSIAASLVIDGVYYGEPTVKEVPVGTTIKCQIHGYKNNPANVYVNGQSIYSDSSGYSRSCNYTVQGNISAKVEVTMINTYDGLGNVYITET